MDNAGDAVQNDLRPVGLGHKVCGAVGQRSDLGILRVGLGHNDDGNQRQPGILLDDVQKGIAIHNGHHYVQQNQGDAVRICAQNIQSHLTVFRLQRCIPISQDFHQHSSVQRVVLDNQYFLLRYHGVSPRSSRMTLTGVEQRILCKQ